MTSEFTFVKSEVLPDDTNERQPPRAWTRDPYDQTVGVKPEVIFIPEFVGVKTEADASLEEEQVTQLEGSGQFETVLSPSNWSSRLLEVTHETDCGDETKSEVSQNELQLSDAPDRHHTERDPFARVPPADEDPGGSTASQPFECAHCCKTFFSRYCITRHVFVHTPEIPAPSCICELCGDVFGDTSALAEHITHHQEQTAELDISLRDMPPVSRIRPYVCRTCGASFTRASHLKVHETIHSDDRPHSCKVCGKRFRQSIHLTNHMRLHSDERPYSCEVCGKAFRQSVHLQIHTRIHSGYRPFSCDVCGRTFVDRTSLNKHKPNHSRDHPYTCDICKKSFRDELALRGHREGSCSIKPYTCEKCGKSFVDPFALKRHSRVHDGKKRKPCDVCGHSERGRECDHDKPNVCHICGKAFARGSSLKRHSVVHDLKKEYECKICGKAFKYEKNLAGHKCGQDTTPKPFSCDICGKGFRFRYNVNLHRKVHTGESSHTCDVCGKSFSSAGNLRSHTAVHSDDRPFSCDVCGATFRRTGNLAAHKATHVSSANDCNVCRKSFNTAAGLRRHLATHEDAELQSGGDDAPTMEPSLYEGSNTYALPGALTYECGVCQSSFSDAASYWRHSGEHAGDVHHISAGTTCVNNNITLPAVEDFASAPSTAIGSDLSSSHLVQPLCEPEMIVPVGPEIVNMYLS